MKKCETGMPGTRTPAAGGAGNSPPRRWAWALAVIALVLLVYFHRVVLHPGLVLSSPFSDYTGFLLPRTAFVWNHILSGEGVPLWRPGETCGIPTLGNPQVGVFYPLNLLVLLLGPLGSLGPRLIISVFFAAAFTVMYCREIGMGTAASIFSGLAFMLCGFMATNLYAGHLQHLSAIAWFPLCLFFAERIVRMRSVRDAVGLGVCFAYQFLAGHPQYFVYSLLVTGAYFIAIWLPRRSPSPIGLVALAAVLFVALSAIQLFPTAEFTSEMTRGKEGFKFYTGMSLPPVLLPTFFQPNLLGSLAKGAYWGPGFYWEFCGYAGVTTLALAAAGGFFSRAGRSRLLLALAAVALLFSMGSYTPFYGWVCRLLPLLTRFRVPSRMLFVYSFAVSVLAGMGLEALAGVRRARALGGVVIAVFCAVALAVGLFRLFPAPFVSAGKAVVSYRFNLNRGGPHTMSLGEWRALVPRYYEMLRAGTGWWPPLACLGTLSGVMLCWRGRRGRAFCAAVTAIMCVELLSFDLPLVTVREPREFHQRTPLIAVLERDRGPWRLMDLSSTFTQADLEPYGIQTALNSESGFIRRYVDLLTLTRFRIGDLEPGRDMRDRLNRDFEPETERLAAGATPLELIGRTTRYRVDSFAAVQNGLDLMNVKYVCLNNPVKHPGFELAFSNGSLYLYENRNALPRAFLVPAVRVVPGRLEAFSLLARIDPREVAVVPGGMVPFEKGEKFRAVSLTRHGTDSVTCRVTAGKRAFLVLSGIWYPGWEAYDNGRRREVVPAYHALRGIALAPGAHAVEFRYNPWPYRVGRAVSIAGIFAALCIVLAGGRRHDGE